MAGFYENITVSAAVPNAAADAEAAKDAAVTAKNEAEAAKDAAEIAKNLAEQHKDTASGYVGTVSGAQSIADANVASTAGDKQAAEDARDLALQYRNTAQSASTAATNAVNQVSANAATVAGMSSEIDAVYNVRTDITDVANNLTGSNTIGTVAPYVNQINTVSGITTEIVAVNADAADIGTVATDLTGSNNIGTVAGLAPKINTVAGLSSELTSVHGNNADITTVATSLNAGNIIANVSSSIGNVNNVGNNLAEIEAVKNALTDIAAVENKLTEIDSVSDSITNVDTVAGVISEVQTVAGVSDEVANLSASTGNMETLVSKLGQTTDLAGAVTDAQNSATSASSSASTAATQATAASNSASTAATHAANLGSVAYQNLTAIAESKAVSATDVFVYDTSKDSDGGAWRNRTQGTSWYNEALNTSTRGATKKFPAVAVIVAEQNKITIYDGDNPSMPMWMVFNAASYGATSGHGKKITALNGLLLSANSTGSTREVDFIKDSWAYRATNLYTGNGDTGLASRNEANTGWIQLSTDGIVNTTVNDIAVTVLPNAPIDPDTGLPVPTIAVATQGGVSVIKDDGSVVDLTYSFVSGECDHVYFLENGGIGYSLRSGRIYQVVYDSIPDADTTAKPDRYYTTSTAGAFTSSILPTLRAPTPDTGFGGACFYGNNIAVARPSGLSVFHDSPSESNRSQCFITKDYNTGWMNGDTKLATLMDTTAETISAPELVTNGDFSSFGSDLVSNGDFSNGTTGWTGSQSTTPISVNNGRLKITEDGGTNTARAYQEITCEIGKVYQVGFDIHPDTATASLGKVYVTTGTSISVQFIMGASGTYTASNTGQSFTFKATTTNPKILLTASTNLHNGDFVEYDNITVKEVTGWTATNGELEVTNGQITHTNNGLNGNISQILTGLTTGRTYIVSFDLVNEVGNGLAYAALGGHQLTTVGSYQVGTHSYSVTLTNSSQELRFSTYANPSQSFTIDNVSVRLAVPDRSVSNNGLNIVGNVTKQAVATGAELVGYKGDGSNYLTQPHNSDLDVIGDGTAHPHTMMGWFTNRSTGSYMGGQGILLSANQQTDQFISWQFQSSDGSVGVWVKNTSGNSQYTPAGVTIKDQWNHVAWVNEGSNKFKIYVNGKFIDEVTLSEDKFPTNISNRELIIGKNNQLKSSLVKMSLSTPTAEQIAKIYRDEKPLFQEGAKCTLYGDFNSVNALAYDEDTGILYAGTTGSGSLVDNPRGRSEFKGLQRVSENSGGVGTAISAANGLVVEE